LDLGFVCTSLRFKKRSKAASAVIKLVLDDLVLGCDVRTSEATMQLGLSFVFKRVQQRRTVYVRNLEFPGLPAILVLPSEPDVEGFGHLGSPLLIHTCDFLEASRRTPRHDQFTPLRYGATVGREGAQENQSPLLLIVVRRWRETAVTPPRPTRRPASEPS
jgi:hypothetical protein